MIVSCTGIPVNKHLTLYKTFSNEPLLEITFYKSLNPELKIHLNGRMYYPMILYYEGIMYSQYIFLLQFPLQSCYPFFQRNCFCLILQDLLFYLHILLLLNEFFSIRRTW